MEVKGRGDMYGVKENKCLEEIELYEIRTSDFTVEPYGKELTTTVELPEGMSYENCIMLGAYVDNLMAVTRTMLTIHDCTMHGDNGIVDIKYSNGNSRSGAVAVFQRIL